jgi:hypothetical protein
VSSIANKLYLAAIIAIIILWIIAYAIVYGRNKQLSAENAALRLSLVECRLQQDAATSAVERQNAAIEAVRIDTVYIEKRVKEVVQNYLTVRENAVKSMERDTSCENALYNITDLMRRFHGLAMRPENGDEN